jgi:hypothetical protein
MRTVATLTVSFAASAAKGMLMTRASEVVQAV